MRGFEFDLGDAADRRLSGIVGRWLLADVKAALNAHQRARGKARTDSIFAYVVPHDGRTYLLGPQHFGTLIAILCRDMTLRTYRRQT